MQNPEQVLERYYLEARCKLLDLAAILDRYERSAGAGAWAEATDERIDRCRRAMAVLGASQSRPDRAEQVALIFSDPPQ